MSKFISPATLCANDACPMSHQCLRHTNYIAERDTELVLQVLNTHLLAITSDGCEFLHIPQQVTQARGFKKMYGSIPQSTSHNIWQSFPRCGSRRQFYRLLSGEVEILPDYQHDILAYLSSIGADITLGFDLYEEVTV